MRFLLLVLSFSFISCSSPEVATIGEEGVLDKLQKNKECGALDVFYDECKGIYKDVDSTLIKSE